MTFRTEEMEIVKPLTDKREYRRIVLKNRLEVLLISDPNTNKSAASMNVGVGSFSDPADLEGLAHLLEHMLFYASEKYPLEDSYSEYITEHGGSRNACTASEHTNYYFDVNTDCIEMALDRFAQFFIKPLMSADATTREICTVNFENQNNLLSDVWRMNQLHKHLSVEGHPYHKFSTGNWETLEVGPKAKGLDTRQELIKFYEEHYSANQMHLVVYAKESLDKIQSLVEEKFQKIRNSGRSCYQFPDQPCASEHLQILVRTIPIKQGHKLRFVWPITPGIDHYKEGSCRYLSHLIRHEGKGSFCYNLKTLGWATSLFAGEGEECTSKYSFFKVLIDLTDAGHAHMQDIVGLLFNYICLLKKSGVCKWIFDELSAICETDFHYQDKIPPINYVVNIGSNMRLYPPKDWLVGSSLPSNFNSNTLHGVLDELSAKNVRIFWESKKFEGHTDMVEPWYRTAYSIEKIPRSMIEEWILSSPNEKLHLPAPNMFIPTDLSLKNAQEKVKVPFRLIKSRYSTLWYKPDTMFFTPKACVKINFNCPYVRSSTKAGVLTNIFARLLMDSLNEDAYYAQVAGLYCAINLTDTGFLVTVFGYNHKLRMLLETIVEKIAKFEVKTDRFLVIKEILTKEYQNFKYEQPYEQALYYCSLILEERLRPWTENYDVLPDLKAEDLTRFVSQMLSSTVLECYIGGNIERNEAKAMIQRIEDVFFKDSNPICGPLYPSEHLTNRVVMLDRGKNYFYVMQDLNPDDENSALVHYIQVHEDDIDDIGYIQLSVKLQLFVLIAKQLAFHQLRSVEQLGYFIQLMQRNDSGIQGLQFIIQSTMKDPRHIDLRVQAFLTMFEIKLNEMTSDKIENNANALIDMQLDHTPTPVKDIGQINSSVEAFSKMVAGKVCEMTYDQFKDNVNALIDMKHERHKNLREESRFFWQEISDGTLKFDRREAEAAELQQLTQPQMIDFLNEHIKVDAPHKKSLSVRMYGSRHFSEYSSHTEEAVQPPTVEVVDIVKFKESRPLYGLCKKGLG